METPAIWDEDKSLILPGQMSGVDSSVAQYTGGMVQVRKSIVPCSCRRKYRVAQ